MRRFLIILVILAAVIGGAYLWWQVKAKEIITAQVQRIAQGFFVNPTVDVKSDPVQLVNWRQARVPKIVISGKDLQVKNGPQLASAKLVLTDVDVSGPPFHLAKVGGGYYVVTATDDAVTHYLRERGIKEFGGLKIPLDSIAVTFAKNAKTGTTLSAKLIVPVINKTVPINVRGQLVPSSKMGQLDFRVVSAVKQVGDLVGVINPIIDVSSWPLTSEITAVETGTHTVTLRGKVTGATPSLLP